MKKLIQFIFISLFIAYSSFAQTPTVGLIQHEQGSLDDGYVLFTPMQGFRTFLIDKCGKTVKIWKSNYRPGFSVYMLNDGSLLRTGKLNNTSFITGGGIIEKFDWNGNVVWSYTISDTNKCQHHDIKPLPNGNILVIAWEKKTNEEAIAAGRNPAYLSTDMWSEEIIELEPVGTSGANMVWEWHLWDHLIQDYDSTKANYGDVSANPQLININYIINEGPDFIHLNSIDYNPYLDQILLSAHNNGEVWIIDHSTTTEESLSHFGGKYDMGGDLLYRWGNPAAYNQGTDSDKKFFGQHNARWIEKGLPYEDKIMVFNNGFGRPEGDYSTVEIFTPPSVSSGVYSYDSLAYGPQESDWVYIDSIPENFYSANISGAQQLSNGNVLICSGAKGVFFEIDKYKKTVWKYISPIGFAGPISQGTTPSANNVFKCSFYPSNFSGFIGHTITPGLPIEKNPYNYSCNYILGYKLSGTVRYDNTDSTTLSNIRIYMMDNKNMIIDSTLTDISGYYQFNSVYPGTYTLDITTTKKYLNSGPIQGFLTLKSFVGVYNIKTALRRKAGDVNMDSRLNATDALLMNKFFVSLILNYKLPFWIFDTAPINVNSSDVVYDFKGICAGDIGGTYTPPTN